MKTQYYNLPTNEYAISCKSMMPDSERIEGVVIGVHGFCGDKESSAIEAVAREMSKHYWGMICFDFPNHGTSEAKDEQLTLGNCKQDFLKVVAYVENQYPTVKKAIFATSFGGYITLLCENHLKDYRIILRSPAVTMPEHVLADIIEVSLEDFERIGYAECGFGRIIKLPYEFYIELQQNSLMDKRFNREITIIHGDRDTVVPMSDILAFSEQNPGVKLMTIHGADHRYKNPGELEKIVDIVRDTVFR